MAHEYFHELISSHSLSAIDANEGRVLEAHLETCEACREELDQFRSTAAALAFAAQPVEPSPTVRERILKQIEQEPRLLPPEAETGPSATGRVVPFVAPKRSVWASIGSLGAIAATLAFVALLISVFMLWRENRSVKGELVELATQMQTTEAELARERETVALLTGAARLTQLSGTNIASAARATLAYESNGRALLLAKGLPAAPPGKAYQLWFIVGNKKLPGKVFNIDAAGNGSLTDEIPASARTGAVFAVTLEPAQGVTAPTGEVFLVGGS